MKKQKITEMNLIIKEKRNMFENENIKNLDNYLKFDEELTCIICYRQIADHRIKPCMHRGCKECLLTYMVDNTKCFMCRQQIESIQKIPKEEIDIILKRKENKKINNVIENEYYEEKGQLENKDEKQGKEQKDDIQK